MYVCFCKLNAQNEFHVNLSSMKRLFQQLYSEINSYCKRLNDFQTAEKSDSILLGLASNNVWYRVKLISHNTSELINKIVKIFW